MGKPGKKPATTRAAQQPHLAVELPVSNVRKTFALKEHLARDLTQYAAYLSEHHGKAIDEDRVIEGLLATLGKDKAFEAWKRAKEEAWNQ